jgi:hypothetical protein
MNSLARYIELIVEPTFDDLKRNPGSIRHAYLTCVVIYHAIDRAAKKPGKPGNLREQWCKESLDFKLVDIVAHHLKHVKGDDERIPASRPGLPISYALGFGEHGEGLELRNLCFVMRDAIKFLHAKARVTTVSTP